MIISQNFETRGDLSPSFSIYLSIGVDYTLRFLNTYLKDTYLRTRLTSSLWTASGYLSLFARLFLKSQTLRTWLRIAHFISSIMLPEIHSLSFYHWSRSLPGFFYAFRYRIGIKDFRGFPQFDNLANIFYSWKSDIYLLTTLFLIFHLIE